MKLENYEYALGLSSQFPYCGLPIRLDTYSKCQFGCTYCFAKARGGNFSPTVKAIDPAWLERKLRRARSGTAHGLIDEFIQREVPFHMGGMADPFPKLEAVTGITKAVLRTLAAAKYPTVISTKGVLFARDDYLEILRSGPFILQFSVTTADPDLHKQINVGTPALEDLFTAVSRASKAGIPTTCRIQPALPRRESDVLALIKWAAKCGVRFVAVEHLKLGLENAEVEAAPLSQALGYDVVDLFRRVGAKRSGREWILPLTERLDQMLAYRAKTRALGMLFGAADTDLLHFSDGNCCCNGSDLLLPGLNHFSFTINQAIRNGFQTGRVSYSALANEWRPKGSIKRYVNSRSRNGSTIEDHLRSAWNRVSHGPNLTAFFGLSDTDEVDEQGLKIYAIDPAVQRLAEEKLAFAPSVR